MPPASDFASSSTPILLAPPQAYDVHQLAPYNTVAPVLREVNLAVTQLHRSVRVRIASPESWYVRVEIGSGSHHRWWRWRVAWW